MLTLYIFLGPTIGSFTVQLAKGLIQNRWQHVVLSVQLPELKNQFICSTIKFTNLFKQTRSTSVFSYFIYYVLLLNIQYLCSKHVKFTYMTIFKGLHWD